jgi:hypothetical protein
VLWSAGGTIGGVRAPILPWRTRRFGDTPTNNPARAAMGDRPGSNHVRGDQLHNICITTQRHSRALKGTQGVPSVQPKPLSSMSLAHLQGGGRRFDPYSAHH